MIFDFLKKQTEIAKKKELITIMIQSINISEEQKELYLESLDVLDKQWVDNLYEELSHFIENIELKELEDIKQQNFWTISGMKKRSRRKEKRNEFFFVFTP